MRMSTPYYYTVNSGGSQLSNENSVEYTTFDFASPADLFKLGDTCGSNVPASRFSGYTGYTFNPTTVSLLAGEFILSSTVVELKIRNQSTNPTRIDLWEMYPKQFTTTGDFPSLINDVVRNGFGDRLLVNTATPPNEAFAYLYPGVWPQQNPKLTALYKLAKHKGINILPGQSFTYRVSWRTPKLINMERVQNTTGHDYKGVTRHLLLRQIGDVGWDLTANAAAYGQSRLDFAWTIKYCAYASPGLIAKTGLVQDNQPATGNNVYAINPVTGNENLTITNVAGVGVSTAQPITSVH